MELNLVYFLPLDAVESPRKREMPSTVDDEDIWAVRKAPRKPDPVEAPKPPKPVQKVEAPAPRKVEPAPVRKVEQAPVKKVETPITKLQQQREKAGETVTRRRPQQPRNNDNRTGRNVNN